MGCCSTCNPVRLCACRMGGALGILWGVSAAIMAAITGYTATWGHAFVELMGNMYWGYKPGWGGVLPGLGLGFLDGFIGGAILIGLYNLFCTCGCGKKANEPAGDSQV